MSNRAERQLGGITVLTYVINTKGVPKSVLTYAVPTFVLIRFST